MKTITVNCTHADGVDAADSETSDLRNVSDRDCAGEPDVAEILAKTGFSFGIIRRLRARQGPVCTEFSTDLYALYRG